MDLETLKSELQRTRLELQHAHAVIRAMESSKFWQLRTRWLNAKTLLQNYPKLALASTLRPTVRSLLSKFKRKWRVYLEPALPENLVAPSPNVSLEDFWSLVDPVIQAQLEHFEDSKPQISILTPTFNSSLDWFVETILSVLNQTSSAWEWCLVDDGSTTNDIRHVLEALAHKHPRIKVSLQPSSGISGATNKALEMASGDYVCFLDHDDTLTPDAIEISLEKLSQGFDIVYSDEDKIDSGQHYVEPFFKPDWSPEYFRGVMYVGHFLSIRRLLVVAAGGLDSQYDGVQDYELVLRLSEKTQNIGHISKILYHWRKIEGSVAQDTQAKPTVEIRQQAAVNAHLARVGLAATSEKVGNHRLGILPEIKAHYPKISIVIPTKNSPDHLERCLYSLFNVSTYPNFEVILVDNGTDDPKALQIMRQYPIKRLNFPHTFNYSHANNLGAAYAEGDYLVFLNNDTEVLTQDWLQHLLYYAEQPDVGAVGALLLFPDQTVQHAGVVMGVRGTADHIMRNFPSDVDGYAGSLVCAREVSAVTAACMMLKKHDFKQIDCFNEHFFTHYQDVDLCMHLIKAGKRIIFTPRAILVHHESATRRAYYDVIDRQLLLDQWESYIEKGDPFHNRNFDITSYDYKVKVH